ncbi:MAG: LCP family protein [Clostridia bacterium]|nr:LCP family protein [Clostridia bacterium]
MRDDKDIFSSEDWQNTVEIPVVKGDKKEPVGRIFDPWNLNAGGPSESILDSIAKSLKEADKTPETITVSQAPEEETTHRMVQEPETEKTEDIFASQEEMAEEIAPEPEIKSDDTIILPVVDSEKKDEQKDVQATMVVPAVSVPQKNDDDTVIVPTVEPAEDEPEQEIFRQKAAGGRLWPPVLMSSIFMIIACIITLTVGIMPVLMELGFARGMTQIMSPVINAGEPPAYTNVILVGVDKDGYRTDTMMVATYDIEQGKTYIMQLPRDTYVHNNGRVDKKLNSAYFSGIDQLKKEVKMAYGIEIHKYVEVNLEGFRLMIDAIGGVEMDVPINMIYDDPYQDFHIYILKGNQILNGKNAEGFVRFRQNNDGSGYPRGDLQRMEVQREFVMATVKQMISIESLTNINELIKIAQENLKTNLSFDEIYNYCTSILTAEGEAVEFIDTPGEAANLPGGSYFVVDYDGAQKVAQQYFYATQATMSQMKKIVVQPVEPSSPQPGTGTGDNNGSPQKPDETSEDESEETDETDETEEADGTGETEEAAPPASGGSSETAIPEEPSGEPAGESDSSSGMSR